MSKTAWAIELDQKREAWVEIRTLKKRIAELESQIKEISEYAYNAAIGDVCMSTPIDANELASVIYNVTCVNAEGASKNEQK